MKTRIIKKRIPMVIAISFLFISINSAFSQAIVNDPPALAQQFIMQYENTYNAVKEAYNEFQEIQQQIQTVENTYEQIKQAAISMKDMNFDDIKASTNPFDMAKQIGNKINENMDRLNNLQDSLMNESMTIGGKNFSVAEICGVKKGTDENGNPVDKTIVGAGKSVWEEAKKAAKKAAAGYENKLTEEQREAIAREHGMSARNYATLRTSAAALDDILKINSMNATQLGQMDQAREIMKNTEELNNMVKHMSSDNKGSIAAAAQMSAKGTGILSELIGKLYNTMTMQLALQSELAKKEEMEKNARKDKIEAGNKVTMAVYAESNFLGDDEIARLTNERMNQLNLSQETQDKIRATQKEMAKNGMMGKVGGLVIDKIIGSESSQANFANSIISFFNSMWVKAVFIVLFALQCIGLVIAGGTQNPQIFKRFLPFMIGTVMFSSSAYIAMLFFPISGATVEMPDYSNHYTVSQVWYEERDAKNIYEAAPTINQTKNPYEDESVNPYNKNPYPPGSQSYNEWEKDKEEWSNNREANRLKWEEENQWRYTGGIDYSKYPEGSPERTQWEKENAKREEASKQEQLAGQREQANREKDATYTAYSQAKQSLQAKRAGELAQLQRDIQQQLNDAKKSKDDSHGELSQAIAIIQKKQEERTAEIENEYKRQLAMYEAEYERAKAKADSYN